MITHTDGENTVFRAQGNLCERDGVFCISYPCEGDEVTLQFSQNSFRMSRRGQSGLHAEFSTDRETKMELSGEGGFGAIPLTTKAYRCKAGANGFRIHLLYTLKYHNACQNFNLVITIHYLSEEK